MPYPDPFSSSLRPFRGYSVDEEEDPQEEHPEEDGTFSSGFAKGVYDTGKAIGETGLTALGYAGNLLDLPGSMVRDLAMSATKGKWINPFDQILHPFSSEYRTQGRDLNRAWGMAGSQDNWKNFLGGMATEVALDPLTYFTLGAGAFTKGGKAISKAGMLKDVEKISAKAMGKTVGKRVARMTTTPRMMIEAAENPLDAMAKFSKYGGKIEHLDKPLTSLASLNIPFMDPINFGKSGRFAQGGAYGIDRLMRPIDKSVKSAVEYMDRFRNSMKKTGNLDDEQADAALLMMQAYSRASHDKNLWDLLKDHYSRHSTEMPGSLQGSAMFQANDVSELPKIWRRKISEKVAELKSPGPMDKNQWIGTLANAGVKDEELEWSRLDDLFASNPRPNKEEMLKWVDENGLKLSETWHGDFTVRNPELPEYKEYRRLTGESAKLFEENNRKISDAAKSLRNYVYKKRLKDGADKHAASLDAGNATTFLHRVDHLIRNGETERDVLSLFDDYVYDYGKINDDVVKGHIIDTAKNAQMHANAENDAFNSLITSYSKGSHTPEVANTASRLLDTKDQISNTRDEIKSLSDFIKSRWNVDIADASEVELNVSKLITEASHDVTRGGKIREATRSKLPADIADAIERKDSLIRYEKKLMGEADSYLKQLESESKNNLKFSGGAYTAEILDLPGGKNHRELLIQLPGMKGPWSHWNEDGVVAHARMHDRITDDGKKILHVDEIQSDWHAAGHKQGYEKGKIDPPANNLDDEFMPEQFAPRYNGPVQDAPFKSTWHRLAMDRVIKAAIDEGYDGISWTNGATQIDRYSLRKQFSRISWNEGTGRLIARDLKGGTVFDQSGLKKEVLGEYIGDGLAKRIAEQPKNHADNQVLSGDGLESFTDFHPNLYDKKIKQVVDKYAKQGGSKVEKLDFKRLGLAGESMSQSTTPRADAFVSQVGNELNLDPGEFGELRDILRRKTPENIEIVQWWLRKNNLLSDGQEAEVFFDNYVDAVYEDITDAETALKGEPVHTSDRYVHYMPITDKMRKEAKPPYMFQRPEDVAKSPEFKNWFGESKVIDESGKPVVLYHGTSKDTDFKSFKIGKRGAWFTSDPESASMYASQNESMKSVFENGKFVEKNTAPRVIPAYLSIKNPYTPTAEEMQYLNTANNYAKAQGEVFFRARVNGYDGVNMGNGLWVAFDPKQIKSIHNGGEWNPKSSNMLKQTLSGDPKAAISWGEDGKAIFHMFQSADFSSHMHEFAHFASKLLDEKELSRVNKWLGRAKNAAWDTWTQDNHEKFARGLENFLITGKAPNKTMEPTWEKVRKFMTETYKTIEGSSIDIKISPQMQSMYSRLLGGKNLSDLYVPTSSTTYMPTLADLAATRTDRLMKRVPNPLQKAASAVYRTRRLTSELPQDSEN